MCINFQVIFATSMSHYVTNFAANIESIPAYVVLPIKSSASVDPHAQKRNEFEGVRRALTRLILECIESGEVKDPLKADGTPNKDMQQLFLNQGKSNQTPSSCSNPAPKPKHVVAPPAIDTANRCLRWTPRPARARVALRTDATIACRRHADSVEPAAYYNYSSHRRWRR